MSDLPVLHGGGVTLRPFRDDDAPDLEREVHDPDIVRWMAIDLPYTIEDARGFIASTAAAWESREAAHFVMTREGDDGLAGYMGALAVEPGMAAVEIGYWVAAAHRGEGLTLKALEVLTTWLGETIRPSRIELGMIKGNRASARIAEQAGFDLLRIDREAVTLDGVPTDEIIYVLK